MSLSDSIADFLTRIRNGQSAVARVVKVSYSSINLSMLTILRSEGFIADFFEKPEGRVVKIFEVHLKYFDKRPVINQIKRISRPGKRVYSAASSIPKFHNGLGLYIISTSKGVMSDFQARKLRVGGEILCGVF